MPHQVFLSKLAEKKLELLLLYLETNWSQKVRDNFRTTIANRFQQVSNFPFSCPESEAFPGLFRCTVTKQTSFYYEVTDLTIVVLDIRDNRQYPDDLGEDLTLFQ